MKDLKIVFMGTPEFAVTILDEIVNGGYEIAGVITAPDRPAGRGRKLQESAVKTYAVSKGLPVLQPTNLKSPEFLAQLKALQHNIQVVVAFRMLPLEVWKMPEYGTFNLHASLLPQYRGAAPINWAMINGETTTGVSTFYIDEKIDTGRIILNKEVPIDTEENAGDLHDKLMQTGAELVLETLSLIKNDQVKTIEQIESNALKDAPKLTKENTKINWDAPLEQIFNLIRGLNPYPGAWCYLENGRENLSIKIFDVNMEKGTHSYKPGKILKTNKNLQVAVHGGFIDLIEIQLPGKRKMQIKDLINGYNFADNANVL